MKLNTKVHLKNKSNKTSNADKVETTANDKSTKVSPIGESADSGENKAKLQQCEAIIRQNEGGAFITGRNLAQINKEELYKADGFTAFEAYCKDRWGISDKYAYRLIDAAKCYDVLAKHPTDKDWVLPRNESQIRPLIPLGEKEWVPAWKKVMKKFAGKPFTAENISDLLSPPEAKAVKATTTDNASSTNNAGEAAETAEEMPANKLKEKLDTIDKLVSKALESVGADAR